MRGSEFVHLRQQLDDELKAWALATHTVERLRTRGIYESPQAGPAAASKLKATRCAGPPRASRHRPRVHVRTPSPWWQAGGAGRGRAADG